MANIIRTGGSGGIKNFIYKNGIFTIQPTHSNYIISNGKLTNGNYLRIPYIKENEIVYVKYHIVSSDRVGVSFLVDTVDMAVDGSNNAAPEMTLPYFTLARVNQILVVGKPSNQSISVYAGTNAKTRISILEIWTEKA